jgi:hypothetical protein
MVSDDPLMQRADSPISFTTSQTMDIEMAVDHLLKSTAIIISRIWSKDTINTYLLRKQSAEDNRGFLVLVFPVYQTIWILP